MGATLNMQPSNIKPMGKIELNITFSLVRPSLVEPGDHLLLGGDVLVEQHVHRVKVGRHRDVLGVSVHILRLRFYMFIMFHA